MRKKKRERGEGETEGKREREREGVLGGMLKNFLNEMPTITGKIHKI